LAPIAAKEARMTLRTGNKPPGNKRVGTGRAFTLVEMVLVMALLVVMLAFVAPSLSVFSAAVI